MENKINIIFLTKQEALFEYKYSNYFKNMTNEEIEKRRKRLGCIPSESLLEAYERYIQEFTQVEKEQFISAAVETMKILRHSALCGMSPNMKPIGIIQLKSGIDWDSPYTINHCIVIPRINAGEVTPETIIHEFIHILQRYKLLYPKANEYFSRVYDRWGFKQAPRQIIIPKDFTFRIMTNPDGDNFEYIWIADDGTTWLPLFGEDEHGEMTGCLTEIQDGIVSPHWIPIEKCKNYIKKIGNGPVQLYHPNEIIACNISYNLTH